MESSSGTRGQIPGRSWHHSQDLHNEKAKALICIPQNMQLHVATRVFLGKLCGLRCRQVLSLNQSLYKWLYRRFCLFFSSSLWNSHDCDMDGKNHVLHSHINVHTIAYTQSIQILQYDRGLQCTNSTTDSIILRLYSHKSTHIPRLSTFCNF